MHIISLILRYIKKDGNLSKQKLNIGKVQKECQDTASHPRVPDHETEVNKSVTQPIQLEMPTTQYHAKIRTH